MSSKVRGIETFDEKDIQKLKKFADDLNKKVDTGKLSEDYCKINFEKAINNLQKLSKKDYETEKCKQILKICTLITLAIQLYFNSDKMVKWLVSLNMHKIFSAMLDHYLGIIDQQYADRTANIDRIIAVLVNITFLSDRIAEENINSKIAEKILIMLTQEDFLSAERINNVQSIDLYDTVISFLYNNVILPSGKKGLIELKAVDTLVEHKQKLDEVLSGSNDTNDILHTIKSFILMVLSKLFNDQQLENNFDTSSDIVIGLLNMIEKTIQKSTTNVTRQNTKFYYSYEIGKDVNRVYASQFITSLLKISANDKIKQVIYDNKGLNILTKILEQCDRVNEERTSCELFLSLTFNEVAKQDIKNDLSVRKVIENKSINSNDAQVKSTCKTIIDIVNDDFEKNFLLMKIENETEKQTKLEHVMISYFQEDKAVCAKLNEILKLKGFKTWIDFEQMSKFNSFIDGITYAVSNAFVVIICYSNAYRTSVMCRLEAEACRKSEKIIIPIKVEFEYEFDGWLKFLSNYEGGLDLSNRNLNEKDESVIELIKYIKSIYGTENESEERISLSKSIINSAQSKRSRSITSSRSKMEQIIESFENSNEEHDTKDVINNKRHQVINDEKNENDSNKSTSMVDFRMSSALSNQSIINENKIQQRNKPSHSLIDANEKKIENNKGDKKESIKKWTKIEVKDYLIKSKLHEWIEFFKDYDGLAIIGLCQIKKDNPQCFYELLNNEIKQNSNNRLTLMNISKLVQILTDLV